MTAALAGQRLSNHRITQIAMDFNGTAHLIEWGSKCFRAGRCIPHGNLVSYTIRLLLCDAARFAPGEILGGTI